MAFKTFLAKPNPAGANLRFKIIQNVSIEFFIFGISTNFVLFKLTCLVTLVDRKLFFQKLAKLTIFGIFDLPFLSTQN